MPDGLREPDLRSRSTANMRNEPMATRAPARQSMAARSSTNKPMDSHHPRPTTMQWRWHWNWNWHRRWRRRSPNLPVALTGTITPEFSTPGRASTRRAFFMRIDRADNFRLPAYPWLRHYQADFDPASFRDTVETVCHHAVAHHVGDANRNPPLPRSKVTP